MNKEFGNHNTTSINRNIFNHKRNDDAYITASFWAFFSIGRLLSIFIATKITPSFMILIDLVSDNQFLS